MIKRERVFHSLFKLFFTLGYYYVFILMFELYYIIYCVLYLFIFIILYIYYNLFSLDLLNQKESIKERLFKLGQKCGVSMMVRILEAHNPDICIQLILIILIIIIIFFISASDIIKFFKNKLFYDLLWKNKGVFILDFWKTWLSLAIISYLFPLIV
jgi:hypothetical protein